MSKYRFPFRCLAMAALVALGPLCWASPAPPRPANLLLITVDTLRPDALGWVAGPSADAKRQTPELDAMAAQGVRFPAAVSPAPITLPSHTSIMTGYFPRRHGVRDNGQVVPAAPPTLAEAVQKAGYATAAFVSGFPLASQFGLDRGFGHYDDGFVRGSGQLLERPAEETTTAALAWVKAAREPWMLWVHYYDPHDPYDPPAKFRRSGPRGAYDGEVTYVDGAIGRLRANLPVAATASLLTVFAADHGESLGEHGENTHGYFIYDSTLLVPLVFHFPRRLAPREGKEARLVDVAPTILDLLGLPSLPATDGVSLVPTLEGREQEVPAAYLETQRPWISYGWSPLSAVRQGGWKLIAAPKPELYDLRSDPGELLNRVDDHRPRARELQAVLRQMEAVPAANSETATDPESMARLRSLGYAGAGGQSRTRPPRGLADPKDRLSLWNLLGEAEEKMAAGDLVGAVNRFDAVLKEDPKNPFALARSGMALMEGGDAAAALPRLERAVAVDPDGPDIRFALAHALTRLRRLKEAEQQWLEVLRLQPRRGEAWVNLGNAFGMQGKVEEAVGAFERAVEIDSKNPELLVRLAFAEHSAGRVALAVEHLEASAAMVPAGGFPHAASLGLLYLKLERPIEAKRWILRSRPSESDFARGRVELARLELRAGKRDLARKALVEALKAVPSLRGRLAADPFLGPLIP